MPFNWWFKVVLALIVFIPPYAQIPFSPENTTAVIASVMAYPLITSISWVAPLAKWVLLAVVVVLLIMTNKGAEKVLLGYYVIILIIVGLFQNMSFTTAYGFVWLIGNTIVQLIVAVFCLYDLIKRKTVIRQGSLKRSRLWVIPLMVFAFLMPYEVNVAGDVYPAFPISVLFNEAGVTYCMNTPVLLGILVLFSDGVYPPTLSIISYVGLVFAALNLVTWFGIQPESWWMGILHLPLLAISILGLLLSDRAKKIRPDAGL